jgi:hypothetical protein
MDETVHLRPRILAFVQIRPFIHPESPDPSPTPELLKKKDEEVDINYLRTLVTSAMQQQRHTSSSSV